MMLGNRTGYVPLRRGILAAVDAGDASGKQVGVYVGLCLMVSDQVKGSGYIHKHQGRGMRVGGGVWIGTRAEFVQYSNGRKKGSMRTFTSVKQLDSMLDEFVALGWIKKRRDGNSTVIVINKFTVRDVRKGQSVEYRIDTSKLKSTDPIQKWLNPPFLAKGAQDDLEAENGGFSDNLTDTPVGPFLEPDGSDNEDVSDGLDEGYAEEMVPEMDTKVDTLSDTLPKPYPHLGLQVPLESEACGSLRIKNKESSIYLSKGADSLPPVSDSDLDTTPPPTSTSSPTPTPTQTPTSTLPAWIVKSMPEPRLDLPDYKRYVIPKPEEGEKGITRQFWNCLDRDETLVPFHTSWALKFKSLLTKYSFKDLTQAIHWIFYVDDFWVKKLGSRTQGTDPLTWLLTDSRLETQIMKQFRGHRSSLVNAELDLGKPKQVLNSHERRELHLKSLPPSRYGIAKKIEG